MKKIDKALLLQATDGGLDFYQYVFQNKLIPNATENRMENVFNPFCEDTKASFSIYIDKDRNDKDTRWFFKDHGDEYYSGDVFSFAAYHYTLDLKQDFKEIMERIATDLKIDSSRITNSDEFMSSNLYKLGYELTRYTPILEKIQTESYFLRKYRIPYEICLEYNTCAIKEVSRYVEDHKLSNWKVRENEYLIAYRFDEYAKIYHPLPIEEKKFFLAGTLSDNYVFGLREIQNRVLKYKTPRDILILTGGEKDVLSLATLGYDAISLYSENSEIPQEIIENLFPSYDKVLVMYDNDKTGIERMHDLCKKHRIWRVILPQIIQGKKIKDISNCMEYKIDRAILEELITNAEQPYKEVEQIKDVNMEEIIIQENSTVESNESYVEVQEDSNSDDSTLDYLLPLSIYENLPSFLQKIVVLFENRKDKDIVLLSSLTVLSTCFPKVKGIYDNELVGSNLYFFLSAPPASGKAKAQWSRKLVSAIDDAIQEQYENDLELYQTDLAKYEKDKANNPDIKKPQKPVQKSILIPGDSSDAYLKEILGNNENFGLLFETEANVLSGTFKKDWGDYSTTLRQAFHHERLSTGRKGTGLAKAETPHLSVVLTGTPNQIHDLMPNIQNGLMSRFLFYNINSGEDFKNPFASKENYNTYYKGFANEISEWWKIQNTLSSDCFIWVDDAQQLYFVEWFKQNMNELRAVFGFDIDGSVKRMGIIHFRICMILTALRQLEANKPLQDNLYINDMDFMNATNIIETLFKHISLIYGKMTINGNKNDQLKSRQKKLYDMLPKEFTWEQYRELAVKYDIPKGTSENYLRQFEKRELISRIKQGYYQKQ